MRTLKASIICAGILSSLRLPVLAAEPAMPLASLTMTPEPSGIVDVPVKIAGQVLNFRVHTGDAASEISAAAATKLGLARDSVPVHFIMLFGGFRAREYAIADSFGLERFTAPGAKLAVLPNQFFPVETAGQLGTDVLRNYDIEFDFRAGKLNVYSPGQCAGVLPPEKAAQLPLDEKGYDILNLDVELDGKPVTAVLETGAPISTISLRASQDMFGITEKTPGLKSIAAHNGLSYLVSYPFKSLALQGAILNDPDIDIETRNEQRPPLFLGASVLRRLHFCISYSASMLYVATADRGV